MIPHGSSFTKKIDLRGDKEGTMPLYFAYGSNMSTLRLAVRVPSARRLCIGRLPEHRLMFHKKSSDGSGKCDAFCTGNTSDFVIGVLFDINESEKKALDNAEGLGKGYMEKEVVVTTELDERRAFL
jgi:gamma-glutamylcyclotransferase